MVTLSSGMMSNEGKKINLLPFYKNKRPEQIIFIVSFLLPVCVVIILLVVLPVYLQSRSQHTKKTVGRGETTTLIAPSAESAERLAELQAEEAYLKSVLQLSKKDSIMLSIDLRDSVLAILIKGIPARECTIKAFSISHAIRHIARGDTLQAWLYPPFKLQREWATIPKSPIRIMDAPKDTIEANAMAAEEIPIERNDVHFTMQFDRNLTVVVEQLQTPSWEGRKKKLIYNLQRLYYQARNTIAHLKQRKLPRHDLRIELYLSREDAKAVYRATPKSLEMALRL